MTNQLLQKSAKNHEIEFSQLTPQDFKEAFDTLIPKVLQEHEAEAMSADLKYQDLFDSSHSDAQLGMVIQYLDHLNSVSQTPEIRELYEEYIPKVMAMYQEFIVDERIYYKLGAYTFTQEYKELSVIKQKMIQSILHTYEVQGVALEQDKKDQLKKIAVELTELQTQFSNNLVDTQAELNLSFTKDEVIGLPKRALKNLKEVVGKKAGKSLYKVSYTSGLFDDIMMYADNADTRRQVYEAKLTLGVKEGRDNRPLLPKIASLLHKQAEILGYSNYAEFNMMKNMVKYPEEAIEFIQNLAQKSIPQAKKESAEIEAFGSELLKKKVNFEDRSYVVNNMKTNLLNIDQEKIRKYFPVKKVVAGLFDIVENIYGIKFVKKEEDLWHEDAMCYDLLDANEKIGTLYLDLYKREFKSDGAWMKGVVSRDIDSEGLKLPIAYIVCNAPKDVGQESTFEFEEIITLFHEMGHALHHLLTKVDVGYYSGINRVQHDAIELPSQFMENFCWDYEVLKKLSSHTVTAKHLPKEIFDDMVNAKNFLSATQMLRQAKFSQVDMKIYADAKSDPLTIEKEVFTNWATTEVDDRSHFLPTFSHIFAGGYSAGYYAYKWAEVLSADAFAALKESGTTYLEQKETAKKFREHILERGGFDDMNENFFNFRGRNPDIKYLLEDSGIKDNALKNKM